MNRKSRWAAALAAALGLPLAAMAETPMQAPSAPPPSPLHSEVAPLPGLCTESGVAAEAAAASENTVQAEPATVAPGPELQASSNPGPTGVQAAAAAPLPGTCSAMHPTAEAAPAPPSTPVAGEPGLGATPAAEPEQLAEHSPPAPSPASPAPKARKTQTRAKQASPRQPAPPQPATAWWPSAQAGKLNILFVGSASFGSAIAILTDSAFASPEQANHSIEVKRAGAAQPVPPRWVVATNRTMLLLPVSPGEYTVHIGKDLSDAVGKPVADAASGIVVVK